MFSWEMEAVVIYDSRLFNRTGQVRRWADRVERRFTSNARAFAPVRSGELASSIHGYVARDGPVHLTTTISADADHALYVLGGTTGPIFSSRPIDAETGKWPYMRLRPGNGYPQLFRTSVAGQTANNFFGKAATATARRHSSLRGWDPQYGY